MAPSLATVRRIVERYDRSASVERVQSAVGSAEGRVFEVRLANDAPSLMLKLFDPEQRWQLEQEALVFERLRRAGVPVPEVLWTDASHEWIDADWMLTRKLPGSIVSALDLSASDAREIYRALGATLRRIHGVASEHFGYFDQRGAVDPFATNRDLMRAWFERDLRRFSEAGGSPRLRAALERRIEAGAAVIAGCRGAVLCHNDLHEANVLVQRGPDGWQVTGVLDVGGAVAADPLFDLARTDYWSTRGDPEKRAGLREGYGAPVGPDAEAAIELYTLHHALELWSWFARAPAGQRMREEIASDLEHFAEPA